MPKSPQAFGLRGYVCKIVRLREKAQPRDQFRLRFLPADPPVSVPIAATLMFPEHELLSRSPAPIVFVNDHSRIRRVAVGLMRMPAHMAGANDGGRGAHGRACKHRGPQGRTRRYLVKKSHSTSPCFSDIARCETDKAGGGSQWNVRKSENGTEQTGREFRPAE